MIDSILDAMRDAFKADSNLAEIKKYHKVEGMLSGIETTMSLWVPKEKFEEYDSNQDEVKLEVHIGVSLHDMDAERGEQRIRKLAQDIRLLLVADQETLGGLIDSSFFATWEFASVSSDKGLMLHLAEGIWEVTYYAPRYRDNESETITDISITENIYSE